jgi:hypothetical protein
LTRDSRVGYFDAMRVGLHGMVRRVWGRRGVKVRQRLQVRYEGRYLVLAVDGRGGQLRWTWNDTMRAEALIPVVRGFQATTAVEALIWDGAPSHRDERLARIELPQIALPPYAPELNPAERVFEEIRRRMEGQIDATLDDKVAAVTAIPEALAANPAQVRQLTGWAWLQDAFAQLPAATPAAIAA